MAKTTKAKGVSTKKVAGGVAGMAGILAAGAVGYLLFGPDGKKNRKKIEDWKDDMQEDIIASAKKMKTVTKNEFGDVIDTVTKEYTKLKKMSAKEAMALKKDLQKNWEQIAVNLIDGDYDEAEKKVTKAVSKRATAVKKKATTKAKKTVKKATPKKKAVAKK